MTTMTKPFDTKRSRRLETIVQGRATSDGAGVQLTRVIGHSLQQRMDPFLMLDAFGSQERSDYQGGFPDHPHRGFETLTYLLAGRMRHHDSAGHEGLLEAGGMQWMSAGRGVIHSEMPEQEEGLLEGFQLWINLPAKDKLSAPAYREVAHNDIPRWTSPQGTSIAILMGALMGMDGAIQRPLTEPLVLDIKIEAGVTEWIPLKNEHHAALYVIRGGIALGQDRLTQREMGILEQDATAEGVYLTAERQSQVLLIAGKPLQEPIIQQGPFVMNTTLEILQAIEDFRNGRLTVPPDERAR